MHVVYRFSQPLQEFPVIRVYVQVELLLACPSTDRNRAFSWFGWPADNPPALRSETSNDVSFRTKISLTILYGRYAANALGLVPVMILMGDYIARGLGRGGDIGAAYWRVYGIAAIVGPVMCGGAADKIGFRLSFRAALLLQGVAVGILSFVKNLVAVGIVTALLEIFTTGVVPLSLGRIRDKQIIKVLEESYDDIRFGKGKGLWVHSFKVANDGQRIPVEKSFFGTKAP